VSHSICNAAHYPAAARSGHGRAPTVFWGATWHQGSGIDFRWEIARYLEPDG